MALATCNTAAMKTEIAAPRLGVDLGGTKIEAIIMDRAGDIQVRERIDTPKEDYAATLDAIARLIERVERLAGISDRLPLGIGTPGAVSLKTGTMKNCNSTCLNGRPLREDLQARLDRPVRIANDADCFTLSEASDGAGRDATTVFGVILGTGVGGGICYEGRLLQGINAICGEWGHTTLPLAAFKADAQLSLAFEPRDCYCNRMDCVETWLSGPGFERSFVELTGRYLAAGDIEQAALSGAGDARALVDHYCNLLALALSTVINILDPETIVLGGGMSKNPALYSEVRKYLPRYVFSDQVNTRITSAVHGDSSGVRGAAWLWPLRET